MTKDSNKSLATLEARVRQLRFLCDTLAKDNNDLMDKVRRMEDDISVLTNDRDNYRNKYLNLKTVRGLTSTDGTDTTEMKNRFKKLVREIDKCIASLNE